MRKILSFDEACRTWDALMGQSEAVMEKHQPLLETCEKIILGHPIATFDEAARQCAVLAENIRCGLRSDGLDHTATVGLKLWLHRHADSASDQGTV